MSDMEKKVTEEIDAGAEAAKAAASKAIEKSKDVAHKVGERLEKKGTELQDA